MKMRDLSVVGLCLSSLLLLFSVSLAQEDLPEGKDHPLLSRMPGFYISSYDAKDFGQADFKTEKGEDIKVEGHEYYIGYEIKSGAKAPSELQILRNYENAIKSVGGSVVFEVPGEAWLKLDEAGKTTWVYVFAHCDGGCYELTIVEKEAMSQEVVADAESLARDISSTGHASVYGIHFDFDKTEVKPESKPSLQEIAKLLKQDPDLNLYVVGHTDNVGETDYNMKLSRARAEAVVKVLVAEYGVSEDRLKAYGVGPLAPVAANGTERGRALNRRVELVRQ